MSREVQNNPPQGKCYSSAVPTATQPGLVISAPDPPSTINEQITDWILRIGPRTPQILREHADRTRLQNNNTTPKLNARSKVTGAVQDPSITALHQPPNVSFTIQTLVSNSIPRRSDLRYKLEYAGRLLAYHKPETQAPNPCTSPGQADAWRITP